MTMEDTQDSQRICEKVLPNSHLYVGNFEELLPHGTGKYKWCDGTLYDGEWEKGKMTGKGLICWPSGAVYVGEVSGGFLHGFGNYTGVDGSIYEGSWRMNVQHGLGKKSYCNSDVYEGSWREGIQDGRGKYVWSNGDTYNGSWRAGKMCGSGLMRWANSDMYEGLWLEGLEHGRGSYKFSDGACYVGTWTKGQKDGPGIFCPVECKQFSVQSNGSSKCSNGLSNPTSHDSFANSNKFKYKDCFSIENNCCKWASAGYLWHSGRISHRPTSVERACNHSDIGENLLQVSASCCSCSSEFQNCSFYEREYVQGVLVAEKVEYLACSLPNDKKWQPSYKPEVSRKLCRTITKGDRSFYLMLNLQLGIRYTVGKITPVPKREVRSSDFGPRARIRMYFPKEGSEFTPPHYSIGFFWKDYCPMVFRNLREMFKIDAADYMVSICGADDLKELSSPGKSGSIFYLSQDERFVLKTLRKRELKVLLKMLPEYYVHVNAHENTLITKFFGLHRITFKGGRKVRFMVMGNMFCTELRIHRRYDLKGSSHGRSTNKSRIDEKTTLKDLDLSHIFLLEESWREALFRQLSLDCLFLESQHIIDYSLLLGVHFRAPEHLKLSTEFQSSTPSQFGLPADGNSIEGPIIQRRGLHLVPHDPDSVSNIRGSHIRGSTLRGSAIGGEEVDLLLPDNGRLRVQLGVNMPAIAKHRFLHKDISKVAATDLFDDYDVVLYFGIIDILQVYNTSKKVEHTWKSLKYDPLSISAVEPKMYSRRFLDFLEKVFPEHM